MRRTRNKTRLILTILAAGLLLMVWSATIALAGGGDSPDDAPPGDKYPDDSIYKTTFEPHMLVVKMYPQFSAIDVSAVLNVENVELSLTHSNTYLVKIDTDADPEATAAVLAGQDGIAYAHPNYILNALHPVQGSIPFSDEVHIGSFEGQQAVGMTNLVAAHTDATGDQITVGVIDGGVDFSHPALEGAAVSGWDYIDMDDDAYDEPGGDASGHGTFVAGLIHLVAPDATIRAYRIMDANGGGDGFTLAQAIERAVDDGCDVINLSVALTNQHLAVRDAINYAASMGVVVVAAAGNDADDVPVYPAAESNAIAVAAVDTLLQAAGFTNYGSFIDVCAPGVGTYSAYQDDIYAWWDGTSFAAPFVAGEAALLRQDYPTLLASQIRGKILASAQSVDSENPDLSGKLGYGLIDPSAALEASTGGNDTASIIPDSLHFTHIIGTGYFTPPTQSALLLSSNAPAAYSVEFEGSDAVFVVYFTSTGMTNDTIRVSFEAYDLPAGEYYNRLKITVDGVTNPVYLPVSLSVVEPPQGDYKAYFVPPQKSFTAAAATDPIFSDSSYLVSENAPAAYTAEVSTGYEQFVTLHEFSGTTNSFVYFDVDPGKLPGPGQYIDTIICWVAGVTNPAKLLVNLTIEDNNQQPDTVLITPLSQSFELVCYTLDTLVGQIAILYDGTPHRWAIAEYGIPQFITLADSVGYTSAYAHFVISAGSLEPGDYSDSVQIYVEGLTATPVVAEINLHVLDSSDVPSPVFLSPQSLSFTVIEGSTEIQSGCTMAYLWALNPPPLPNWYVRDGAFADVVDTTGTIYDSICIEVDPSGFAVGSYIDSIIVTLDGYYQPAVLPVHLLVESSDTTIHPYGDSVVLFPFGPIYLVCDEGYTTPANMFKALWNSDGGSRPYTAEVLNGGQFTELLTTSGMTPDTIRFTLDATGFTVGEYIDTISVTVEGYPEPSTFETRLIVNPVDTVVQTEDSLVFVPPGDFHISYHVGDTAVYEYHYRVLATSFGAAVPFVGIVKDGGQFTELLTTSGVTPDTIRFNIDPTGIGIGSYVDTIYFTAEGYNDTAVTLNYLTISPPDTSPPYPLALSPWDLYFTADEGSTEPLTGCAYLWNIDSVTAPYTSDYYYSDGPWMEILTQSGMTPDSVCVQVDPTGLTTGTHYSEAAFIVEGYEYPAVLRVHLTVNDTIVVPGDTTNPLQDRVFFWPPYRTYHVVEGSTDIITGSGYVFPYDMSLHPFTGYVQPGSHFTQLLTTSGMTYDSIYYEVDPTGLSVGLYYDSVYFDVEGFDIPALLTLRLYIDPTSDTLNPTSGTLSQNYPNPFNPTTTISFDLNNASYVSLEIYNILGRKVTTLVNENLAAGEHSIQWDASSAASGIYFYRLSIGGKVETRKMVLLR